VGKWNSAHVMDEGQLRYLQHKTATFDENASDKTSDSIHEDKESSIENRGYEDERADNNNEERQSNEPEDVEEDPITSNDAGSSVSFD
jgi:hypothetical protein